MKPTVHPKGVYGVGRFCRQDIKQYPVLFMMVRGIYMDENMIKQKIQTACFEPQPPEELIRKVVLRSQAVSMGVQAQKRLETAPAEKAGELASRVLIGQLALVSDLPKGIQPETLARKLEQEPAFAAALRGGNIARRLSSGEVMQELAGKDSADFPEAVENEMIMAMEKTQIK